MKQFRLVFLAVVFSVFNIPLQPQSDIPAGHGQANQNWLQQGHYRLIELPAVINDHLNRFVFKKERPPVDGPVSVHYQPLEVTVNVGSGTHEKYNYSYNPYGYLTGELYQTYLNNNWTNHTRYTYTNNSSGYHLTSLQELYQVNTWVNKYLDTYTYNAQN